MKKFRHKESGEIYTINRILEHREYRLDTFVGIQCVPESKGIEEIIVENKNIKECADFVEQTFDNL